MRAEKFQNSRKRSWTITFPLGVDDETEIGAVLGVVDLLGIYRAKDLPPDLRAHEFTNKHADNWCWVVANPRRLSKPFDATGNARLFNVNVPGQSTSEGAIRRPWTSQGDGRTALQRVIRGE